jgi:GDPmannose 4,6-dehydratase
VTGFSGQDGTYLTKHLLDLDYRVIGVVRRVAAAERSRINLFKNHPNLIVTNGDVTDLSSIVPLVQTFKPDEFYHLAAMSHVHKSWKYPVATADITGVGVVRCLEALQLGGRPNCRFYFAGSSEQFGNEIGRDVNVLPFPDGDYGINVTFGNHKALTESSPMRAASPYAAAKIFGYNITRVYRESYGMFASAGVLFNHEGPLRGHDFVTRKITSSLARIKRGKQKLLKLGNIDAKRDWTFAGDMVRGMHLILQQDKPEDYVLASGKAYSVKEFLDRACDWFELSRDEYVEFNDPNYVRPNDVNVLIGDASKAREELGWEPRANFDDLVSLMCQYDYLKESDDFADHCAADELVFSEF